MCLRNVDASPRIRSGADLHRMCGLASDFYYLEVIMADVKKEGTKTIGLSDEQIEAAVKRVMADESVSVGSVEEILSAQAKALAEIASQSVPTDTQAILKKMSDEHESPYVTIEDKIGVLTVSTIDVTSIDGWPGFIDEIIPGEFTKQHLQKRLRIPVEINYEPSLQRRYEFTVMKKAEYELQRPNSSSGIPNSSMVASMALRAGDGR